MSEEELAGFRTTEVDFLRCFNALAGDIKTRKIDFVTNQVAKPTSLQTRKYVQSIQNFATYSRERLLKVISTVFDFTNTAYIDADDDPENTFRDISIKVMKSIKKGLTKDIHSTEIMKEYFWDSSITSGKRKGEGEQNFLLGIKIYSKILVARDGIQKTDTSFFVEHLKKYNLFDIITNGLTGHDLIRELANYSHHEKDMQSLSKKLHMSDSDGCESKYSLAEFTFGQTHRPEERRIGWRCVPKRLSD